MNEMTPSERTKALYKSLKDEFDRVANVISDDEMHCFNLKLHQYRDVPNEIQVEPDDFPYVRHALVEEAVARGDIQREPKKINTKVTVGEVNNESTN